MMEALPNLYAMDLEEFEEYISSKRNRRKSPSPMPVKKVSPRMLELEDLEKRLEAAKKSAEEAQRDDCTVMVLRLHNKASEKDVYSFFSAAAVGKVRDIRIIRDIKTGSSKGVAYVEFYSPDAVLRSMTLSGQMINGQSIIIQPSEAYRNRAATAARMSKAAAKEFRTPQESQNKIYVLGLKPEVSRIGSMELRQLFSSFGEVESVEVVKGVGYVQYKRYRDAQAAVWKMDGAEHKGRRLKLGMADSKSSIREAQRMGDHEEDGTYIRSNAQKKSVSHKLARKHR